MNPNEITSTDQQNDDLKKNEPACFGVESQCDEFVAELDTTTTTPHLATHEDDKDEEGMEMEMDDDEEEDIFTLDEDAAVVSSPLKKKKKNIAFEEDDENNNPSSSPSSSKTNHSKLCIINDKDNDIQQLDDLILVQCSSRGDDDVVERCPPSSPAAQEEPFPRPPSPSFPVAKKAAVLSSLPPWKRLILDYVMPPFPRDYNWRRDLPSDIVAGISVAAMIIPQSLSFIQLSELPMVYGLYASLVTAMTYSFMGRSYHMSLGPFAAASFIIKPAVQQALGVTDPEKLSSHELYIPMVMMSVFLSGCFLFILGVTRLGAALGKVLHPSFITGFTTATALVIIASQIKMIFYNFPEKVLPKSLFPVPDSSFLKVLAGLAEPYQNIVKTVISIKDCHVPTLILAFTTLVLMLIFKNFDYIGSRFSLLWKMLLEKKDQMFFAKGKNALLNSDIVKSANATGDEFEMVDLESNVPRGQEEVKRFRSITRWMRADKKKDSQQQTAIVTTPAVVKSRTRAFSLPAAFNHDFGVDLGCADISCAFDTLNDSNNFWLSADRDNTTGAGNILGGGGRNTLDDDLYEDDDETGTFFQSNLSLGEVVNRQSFWTSTAMMGSHAVPVGHNNRRASNIQKSSHFPNNASYCSSAWRMRRMSDVSSAMELDNFDEPGEDKATEENMVDFPNSTPEQNNNIIDSAHLNENLNELTVMSLDPKLLSLIYAKEDAKQAAAQVEETERRKEAQEEAEANAAKEGESKKATKKKKFQIPDILISIIIFTLVCFCLRLEENKSVKVLGEITPGLPQPDFTFMKKLTFPQIASLLVSSLIVSILTFVLSLSVGLAYAKEQISEEGGGVKVKKLYQINATREAIALALANMLTACFQGFICAGGLSRAAVLKASGAKSHLSTWIAGLIVMATMKWLTGLFYHVPMATLSVIVCLAMFSSLCHLWPSHLKALWNSTCTLELANEIEKRKNAKKKKLTTGATGSSKLKKSVKLTLLQKSIPSWPKSILGEHFSFALFIITFTSLTLLKMEWGVILGVLLCLCQYAYVRYAKYRHRQQLRRERRESVAEFVKNARLLMAEEDMIKMVV